MVQVMVTEGIIQGEVVKNDYGGTYFSFKGIPYAQPPVGDLRFKAPRPPKPWKGVKNTQEFGPVCYQKGDLSNGPAIGSEDCLYLNIYTPDLHASKPLPVMFWIHGGGFVSGSGNDDIYGPEFLLKQGVIVVTINYRLGIIGFLCLDSIDVPGNAGLKDQVAALRWVGKNIGRFGGDPSNITVFGDNAGAACISYHLVSPLTKGIFRRAILQSGAATCWWAKTFEPRERALILARKLGCESKDDKELYDFFKSLPVEKLVQTKAPLSFTEQVRLGYTLHFGIVSEKTFLGTETFFHGDILDYLPHSIHKGVEIVVGYTENEGIIQYAFADPTTMLSQANGVATYFTPELLRQHVPLKPQIEAAKKIKQFYMNNSNLGADWERLAQFHSLELITHGVLKWAKLCSMSCNNKVYLYKFTARNNRNHATHLMGLNGMVGDKALPLDDVFYLFNSKVLNQKIDVDSKAFKMIDRMTKIWTNFSKTGEPTPNTELGVKWHRFTLKKQDYLVIGNELQTGTTPDADEINFWDSIFKEYAPQLFDKS